ncbi:MAG: peptidase U34 [Clostridia bacterium]|nr:peptidase U34 [Clostridia bacterium]
MCDTLFKKDNCNAVFGKNSDRSCNEPNLTVFVPAIEHNAATVLCTYISIPQVKSTNACILVKPSWMWGAEMGINEFSVAIGNEAVFTKKKNKTPSLTGMDYVRIALERGKTAEECLDIIITLLQEYSQGGNCGFDKNFYYDNSFLIADPSSAFILETAGKLYAARKIDKQGNISNRLSLSGDYYKTNAPISQSFSKTHSDTIYTHFSKSLMRQQAGERQLEQWIKTDVFSMMFTLQSHATERNLYTKGNVGSLCMHQSALGDHTTGSMIVNLAHNYPTVWITGCSTPCLSLYKPTYFGVIEGPLKTDEKESLEFWLKREYLLRGIYAGHVNETKYRIRLLSLQSQWLQEEKRLRLSNAPKEDYEAFSKKASKQEREFVEGYMDVICAVKNGELPLPKLWKKKTAALNKNVFARTLAERKV